MDNNIYLNFIYEIASKNYLKEKVRIAKFLKDKKVMDKDTKKRSINVNYFVCEIELDDKRTLILEDIPVNFLLSYTIVAGDRAQLVEFVSKDKKYVCDKSLFNDLKEHYEIDSGSLRDAKARELYNRKYFLHFKQPVIVSHLKDYVSSIKKLPFNRIHVVKGNLVENFVPTIKNNHLTTALQMNIPLVNLLENNFIRESTINIYDDEKIRDIIKPKFEYSKKVLWDVHRKNNLKLYKDISREYVIEFDSEKIVEELLSAHVVNFDRDSVASQIKAMKGIVISANHGRYSLPVWKSSNEQRFIHVENVDAFKAMAGIEFKLDTQFFADIYLQTLSGEQAIYKPRFLSDDLNKAFEELAKSQRIKFSTVKELVVKILYNLEMGVLEVLYEEEINENKTKELASNITKIVEMVIHTSIDFNRKPKYKRAEEIFEEYYFSISNSVIKILDEYKEYPSRVNLLNDTLKVTERVLKSFKMHPMSSEELYFVCLLVMSLLKVLKVFDKAKPEELRAHFNEYFGNLEVVSKSNKISHEVESLVDDIFFVNKVSKKRKVSVFLKKDISLKVFAKGVSIIDDNPHHFSIVKPNTKKLKEVFKYSFKDACEQVSALSVHDVRGGAKIRVREKEVDVKEDYYYIFDIYSDYKVILDNDFFRVLSEK